MDSVLFHARLEGTQVIIEEDNFEAGLSSALVEEGIKIEDIRTGVEYNPLPI